MGNILDNSDLYKIAGSFDINWYCNWLYFREIILMKFQVELTREEVQALAVFKPELRKMIDDYDCSYNIYVHKIGELLGLLRF